MAKGRETVDLTNPIFHDETAAREHLESLLWPHGPECPHCGVVGEATLMQGKTTRPGLYKCRACRRPFTVTMKTVMERSKIPLSKWVLAAPDEYARLGGFVTTNSAEGFFALPKRAVYGQFHHVSEAHLHRYLAEADFKYNHRTKLGYDDGARAAMLLRGTAGKRLMYRQPSQADYA